MYKSYFFIILFGNFFNLLLSQSYIEKNSDYIKTIQLFNTNNHTHTPFISFQDYFVVSFDDIKSSYQKYYYTIKHYNKNWVESDLMPSEYIQGYFNDEIRQYSASFNTLQSYVHYEFQFPNDKISPKISGNYALIIYTKDSENPIFTRRFSVYENNVLIGLTREVANAGSLDKPNQRLFITCSGINGFLLHEISNFTTLTLVQNNNLEQLMANIKPQFYLNNQLKFSQPELLFYGGNEYFMFDTKNIDLKGITTQEIKKNTLYEHYLYPTELFSLEYAFNPDINGEYYIRRNDVGQEREASLQGDYIWVNFAAEIPKQEGLKLYIVGSFNNYILNQDSELQWNEEGFYDKSILLKQGFYNYQVVYSNAENKVVPVGNFWQTSNQYRALLYFSDFNNGYDRLIGLGNLLQNFF